FIGCGRYTQGRAADRSRLEDVASAQVGQVERAIGAQIEAGCEGRFTVQSYHVYDLSARLHTPDGVGVLAVVENVEQPVRACYYVAWVSESCRPGIGNGADRVIGAGVRGVEHSHCARAVARIGGHVDLAIEIGDAVRLVQ